MRITSENLNAQLTQNPTQIYILFGDEPLLIQESSDMLRNHAIQHGFNERLLYTFEGNSSFDWAELANEFNCPSLFTEKKIIELILHSTKINDEGTKFFQSLTVDKNTLFIIRAEKLTPATQKAKWFVALMPRAALVQHWPIERHKLPNFLRKHAETKGLTLEQDAIELLCDQTEGNLLAAYKEIEKLHFLFNNKPISAQEIEKSLTLQGRYTVFDLQNAWLKGETKKALQMMQILHQTGTDFTLILWALCKIVRSLSLLQDKLQQGISQQQTAQELKIWPRSMPLYISAVKRLESLNLTKLLQEANNMDSAFKSGENRQSWRDLSKLSLKLTHTPVS